jgi:hypothetical protein
MVNLEIDKINPIEEYFNNNTEKSTFIDLFESQINNIHSFDNNISLRSDLTIDEIILINIAILNSNLMFDKGMKFNIYDRFINQYMRLKVSLDRKSRQEFVNINKKDNFENNLDKFNAIQHLQEVKK